MKVTNEQIESGRTRKVAYGVEGGDGKRYVVIERFAFPLDFIRDLDRQLREQDLARQMEMDGSKKELERLLQALGTKAAIQMLKDKVQQSDPTFAELIDL